MKTLKFKTNLSCSGCTARIAPLMNKTFGEGSWQVDLESPEKVLTVSSEEASARDVAEVLKRQALRQRSCNGLETGVCARPGSAALTRRIRLNGNYLFAWIAFGLNELL